MKRADVRFLVEVFKTDTAPAFAKMPDDDNTVAFCEMQCILAAAAIRNILEGSTPESRADFVARWMESADERTRKAKAAALAGKDSRSAKPEKPHKAATDAAHKGRDKAKQSKRKRTREG